jgi:isopenicillin N synthase-like dioxygenase
VIKINVPKHCIIVQIGEALEVKTGGLIKALPHAVIPYKRSDPNAPVISRNSMALFIDPAPEKSLDIPVERSETELF